MKDLIHIIREEESRKFLQLRTTAQDELKYRLNLGLRDYPVEDLAIQNRPYWLSLAREQDGKQTVHWSAAGWRVKR